MAIRHAVSLGDVPETMLIPLHARAVESAGRRPIVRDPLATAMVAAIDYDFSRFDRAGRIAVVYHALRTAIFDCWVEDFLAEHPDGTVVEIGAGLGTRCERLDNGRAGWIDLDLPDAMALRGELLAESPRKRMLARSVLDASWPRAVADRFPGPYLFICEGVLVYLQPAEVRRALTLITASFPDARIALDTYGTWIVAERGRAGPLSATSARLAWACDDPKELEGWGLGLRLVESRTPAQPPKALASRLSMGLRWVLRLISWFTPARMNSHRINLYRPLDGWCGPDVRSPAGTA